MQGLKRKKKKKKERKTALSSESEHLTSKTLYKAYAAGEGRGGSLGFATTLGAVSSRL